MAVYKESTYLSPIIRWGMAIFAAVIFSIGILSTLQERSEDQWVPLLLTVIPATIAILLMFSMRLELRINSTEIVYKLFPLEFREKKILLSDVDSIELLKLKWWGGPGGTYGGFGKRRKPWKKHVSYIMNRKYALLIRLKDGRVRLLTTERETRLKKYIQAHLGHLTSNRSADEKV